MEPETSGNDGVMLARKLSDARRLRAQLAAEDPAEFCAFVLRDERTGGPVTMRPMHEAWHGLCDRNPRQVIWAHVESGKTQQMSIGRVLWELGRDPTRRIAVVSNTHGQSAKVVRTIGQYIESSEELRLVFPNLRPSTPWTSTQLTVGRNTRSKDPSVQACGVHGNITGARLDYVVLDDILDYENTRSFALRQDLWDWFHATVVGRLTEWARAVAIGTAYHPDDMLHRLVRPTNVWVGARFPVLDARGNSTWVERWPTARIDARRLELGAAEFARQMMCRARDEEEARFQREWIEVGLENGRGKSFVDRLDIVPDGWGAFTGVDLGVAQGEKSDLTCLFTLLASVDGLRQVVNVESGRWSGPEIVRRIADAHRRYQSVVYVENNAAQDFVVQFAREHGRIPVRAFTTGKNKAHPEFGVEGIAVELQNGRWIIPNGEDGKLHPEIEAWINELLYYSPTEHTGDRLMACVTPGQRVTTARGLVPVEEVRADDLVLTHRARWRRVQGTSKREWSGDAVVLKPRGMHSLKVTPEHPVWSAEAWFGRKGRTNRLLPRKWDWRDAAELRAGRKAGGNFVLAPAASWPGAATAVDEGKPCEQLSAQQLFLSSSDSAKLLRDPSPVEIQRWQGRNWMPRERTNSASVALREGAAVELASIKRVPYSGTIYNLHVEEDESFVVEGIAVHNSWFAREGARSLERGKRGGVGLRVIG